ncbi:VOC family protein [Chamaesiphon minutus]|uniref:Lactoylglutathione lyase-like lyase n=1 Tax=Chamaesiphon minutus (strain ATCC 27169 / PCC 6605) TaxID=1173020 RepID=K9UQC8_CHAP6|nr:VOC family protein [Chamaesiphon minutus]AFY97010.1 lactoylglutathione lyase-like lyase [Chamaesiphon minutus PCC 6605]
MIAYVCLGTNDIVRASVFYDAVLGALGLSRCDISGDPDLEGWVGWCTYGDQGIKEVVLWLCKPIDGKAATLGNGSMVALRAKNWAAVEEFYTAALSNGGTPEGAPGLRLQYNPDFYAAYVRDLDGNKLAVVCRGFTERAGQ